MNIVYRITEKDYMAAHELFAANEKPFYRKLSRRLMPWIGGFVIALQVFFLVSTPRPDIGVILIGFLLGFFLLYCGFALRRYFRRSYRKDHRFKHDFVASISDESINIDTPLHNSQMKWASFVRFLESDEIFMIFLAQWLFLIFPKRAFAPGEADHFRELLQRNVSPEK